MHDRGYSQTVQIANGTALSEAISYHQYTTGIVHIPATWTAANIGFQVASEVAGTYLPLYDDAGALVEIASVAVDQAMAIPDTVKAARYVKLWSQNAGADANQGAERTLVVDLK